LSKVELVYSLVEFVQVFLGECRTVGVCAIVMYRSQIGVVAHGTLSNLLKIFKKVTTFLESK
jgi:hypothetical protein